MPPLRSFDPDYWALGLYAAVLDGKPIEPALQQLAAALGASRVIVHRMQIPRPGSETYSRLGSHNVDPRALQEYASTWVAHDPWALAGQDKAPGTYDLREIAAEEVVVRTPFWNDFLARHNPTLHGITTIVEQPGELSGLFTLWREREAGHFSAEALGMLRALEPHLRRALIAEARLSDGHLARETLEALREGVAVIGTTGRLLHANAALHAMTRQADGLGVTPEGLVSGDRALQPALDRLVGLALRAAQRRGAMDAGEERLALPRPSGGVPWLIEALPMAAARDGRFGGEAAAVLLVADGEARRPPSEQLLGRSFGLTQAEAGLAASLLAGVSLAEHAQRRRIAMPTVRTHLARVLDKTGCRRQADLVAKLSRALG